MSGSLAAAPACWRLPPWPLPAPHHLWYFAWLALLAAAASFHARLWLATAALLLIVQPVPGDRFFWPSLVYVPAILLLLLADLRFRLVIEHSRGPKREIHHVRCNCP